MENLVDTLTRGNVAEVKVVLATVALALAAYQLVLIAVAYGKARPPFLAGRPAAAAHRASGDVIVVLLVVVAAMCVSYFGFDDDRTLHVVAGSALLIVLALKIAVLRWWPRASPLLPFLGTSVFVLLALTWASSAGSYLGES